MTQWEYKLATLVLENETQRADLEELGNAGWELCSVHPETRVLYLKRPKNGGATETAWDRDVRALTFDLMKLGRNSYNVCAGHAIVSADQIEKARRVRAAQTGAHFGLCRHQGQAIWENCRLLDGHEGPHDFEREKT